ncbi:shikimate 5-dehydrogenase [Gluconacetobacter johannae DSM 13595]|uniref:Shikimate dehydrogenase (NADP(+)) n=1 Tax=Gluconacetobacter johannae TaxID=112140 RepID=A0A7W4J648_9PROT|nr:shikimate dehydrogenase [Gluconacetobacter johannae]MBB2175324.1 shikimate dehydrogenase [Gluconacetobacter johannae]GBQ85829.1 shikimate 5-dehydrogenase [Gluconacetobacter johannae DSM 13595]
MSSQTFLAALTGSFSTPCADNPTVAMIEAAYRHHDMNARYINCDVKADGLADAIRGAVAMGWAGFNCSIPHKIAVLAHLDTLAESAAIIGAVNCVVIRDGKLTGENTDGKGFLDSLSGVTDPKGKDFCLLGAGGAARAIAVELALAGARRLTIVNRDAARGRDIAALINDRTAAEAMFLPWTERFAIPRDVDVLINATSVGLGDAQAMPDIDPDSLRHGMIVADVIPNPPRTALLRAAEARGCTTLDGLGMLVNQGVISVRLWFGQDVDATIMARQLQDIFGVARA